MADRSDAQRLSALLEQQRFVQVAPFLTGVVHDMNNSLGAVIAYAELMGMGPHEPGELDQLQDDLIGAARRAASLMEALGSVLRSGKPKRSAVSLPKLVGQLASICEYRFNVRHVQFDVSMEGEIQTQADCYENELARAILILLLNGLENAERADHKAVKLVVNIAGDSASVTVHDTGPPMTPEEFERALNPYVTAKDGAHLGLGLTVARDIATLHNGTLEYEPDTGVRLTVPLEE